MNKINLKIFCVILGILLFASVLLPYVNAGTVITDSLVNETISVDVMKFVFACIGIMLVFMGLTFLHELGHRNCMTDISEECADEFKIENAWRCEGL